MADIGWAGVAALWPELKALRPHVVEALEAEALYAGYIQRQDADIAALRKEDQLSLSPNIDYASMPSLSAELRQKLVRVRPATLGQASRIEGMTPAALAVILGHAKRRDRQSAA
jgi:tRNA uridine 5-carboxymethylaminomethyl modification enzyme